MAAFQRLFRASLGPAAVVSAAAGVTATVAFADVGAAPETAVVNPGRTLRGDKLPIYSSPESEEIVTLVVSHNPLAEHIATAREATAGVVGEGRAFVEKGVSRWIDFERSVEHEVKQIVPKDESLTPGIIYVLVAGLTGSVLTRTRAFPLRFLAPPTFALVALPYFLPKTAHNLRTYVSNLEDKYTPEFATKHDEFNANLELHWQLIQDRLHGVGHEARQWSSKAAQGVESATGLRVSDAARRGRQELHEAKSKVAQATASLREKAQPEGAVVAEPVAERVVFEKVGTLVEETPIAEIVAVVAEPVVVPVPTPAPVAPVAPVAVAPVAVAAPVVVEAPKAVESTPKAEVREVDASGVKPKPKPTERIV